MCVDGQKPPQEKAATELFPKWTMCGTKNAGKIREKASRKAAKPWVVEKVSGRWAFGGRGGVAVS